MNRSVLIAILSVILTQSVLGQSSVEVLNPSYRYVSNPGFVNITDINSTILVWDTAGMPAKRYFGITNVFGYQINRNFFGGFGIGYYFFKGGQNIPIYLEYKYSAYLKRLTPYFFGDGGFMLDPANIKGGSKIFINPGIGISHCLSSKFEGFVALGIMVQKRTILTGASYVNFKLGIIFRKNSFRLYKPRKTLAL
jgi:hypothetical protein